MTTPNSMDAPSALGSAGPPGWSTRRDAFRLVASGATVRPTWKIAAVVGTVVSGVNQGGVVAAGHADHWTILRCLFNYCVPFTVASTAFLTGCRRTSSVS